MLIPPLYPLLVVVLCTLTPQAALALSHFGLVDTGELFVSEDGGVSWSIRSTLPARDAISLIAGATNSDLLLASRSGSIYESPDAGVTWSAVSAIPASDVCALVPFPGRLLLLTRSGGVYASLNGGDNFTAIAAIPASDVAAGARLDVWLFAVTTTGDVYRSGDAGVTWSAVGALPLANVVSTAAFGNRLYVLTSTGDVARSEDLGVSWSFVSTLSQSGMTSLVAAVDVMLAATKAGEVAASTNGVDWTWRGAINQLTVTALASDQPHPTAVGSTPPPRHPSFALGLNPTRTHTTLSFGLEREALVTVTVHDVAGSEVARPLTTELLPVGRTSRVWQPTGLASGFYYVRAQIGDYGVTRALTWLQ